MPYSAEQLIADRSKPIVVGSNDKITDALKLMALNDYSQLPVVDSDGKPIGIVTSDSILEGLVEIGARLDKLRVRDVTHKIKPYDLNTDIFELIEYLNADSAILVIDGEKKLIGIITNWDMADYFRRRAEAMILIEDIEENLCDHIDLAFTNSEIVDDDVVAKELAVNEVYNAFLVSNGQKIINLYVKSLGTKFDQKAFDEACNGIVMRGKSIEDLTLNQLVDLFTHKSRWGVYGQNFSLEDTDIRQWFKKIIAIRSNIAHFREELTADDIKTLRACVNWLDNNRPITRQPVAEITVEELPLITEIAPIGEEGENHGSPYALLANYLQQITTPGRFRLEFTEIDKIIGTPLPRSAREHRSWWANDTVSHTQSKQWIDVGWRVANVNFSEGVVTFTRAKDRETLYIRFYGALLDDLRKTLKIKVRDDLVIGTNWINIFSIRGNHAEANFAFTFAKRGRFRAEVYIYSQEVDDEAIFNQLYLEKDQFISPAYELRWESLEGTRASRIAIYHEAHINEDEQKLAELRQWAVTAMKYLLEKFRKPLELALSQKVLQ